MSYRIELNIQVESVNFRAVLFLRIEEAQAETLYPRALRKSLSICLFLKTPPLLSNTMFQMKLIKTELIVILLYLATCLAQQQSGTISLDDRAIITITSTITAPATTVAVTAQPTAPPPATTQTSNAVTIIKLGSSRELYVLLVAVFGAIH
jgi:hypothetical protein